jgi:very-short-patch-repair endonuclease
MSEEPQLRRNKHKTLGASDQTIRTARRLRKNMSLPEVLLWVQLQQHPGGYLFRKQHPIGPYVLDFCCVRARLAIEVDGESHDRGDRPARDEVRDAWVLEQEFDTIRFPAKEVLKNMEGVLLTIVAECQTRARPYPLRNGEVDGAARRKGPVRQSKNGEVGAQPAAAPPTPTGPPPRSGEELS